jgi:hypothetical protein
MAASVTTDFKISNVCASEKDTVNIYFLKIGCHGDEMSK